MGRHPRGPGTSDETLRIFEAFEFWFWSQPRSFEKVAKRFGVTDVAVGKWARLYNWNARASERDDKLKKALADKHDSKALKIREQLLRVAEVTLSRYGARLIKDPATRASHGVTLYEPTGSDAVRFSQMLLLLTGQATSRNEFTIGRGFVDAFLAMATGVLRKVLPRACPHCKTVLDLPERAGRALIEASAQLTASANAGSQPPTMPKPAVDDPPQEGA